VEPYRPTKIDIRKLGLCATLVTFQTPPSEYYTFKEGDIVGIGKEKYLPYTFRDLSTLIRDYQLREDSRTLDSGTVTSLLSTLIPIAMPFGVASGIMAAQGLDSLATGGTAMYDSRKTHPSEEIANSSGFFPLWVSGRESEIFYFPSDVHTIEVSVKGKPILFPLVASTASPSEKLTKVPAKISKAYATKDSGFIHHRNCPKIAHLLVGKELIEFTSLEEALQSGGKSCETCKDYFQKSLIGEGPVPPSVAKTDTAPQPPSSASPSPSPEAKETKTAETTTPPPKGRHNRAKSEKTEAKTTQATTPSSLEVIYVKEPAITLWDRSGTQPLQIATLPKGTKLTVLGQEDKWCHVKTEDGREGWVASELTSSQP